MADTDEEQLEALRRWWRENGRSIIAGVVIGLAALGGWSGWNWYHGEQALAASDVYEDTIAAVEQGNYGAVSDQATRLRDDYGGTAYATLGALAAARAAVEEGDLDRARNWLRWTVDEASAVELATVGRARLARVLAAQGDPDAALSVLDVEVAPSFQGLFAEVRGDALAQQGERDAAVEAYEQALDADGPVADRELIERKLNRLGAAGRAPGSATASS